MAGKILRQSRPSVQTRYVKTVVHLRGHHWPQVVKVSSEKARKNSKFGDGLRVRQNHGPTHYYLLQGQPILKA